MKATGIIIVFLVLIVGAGFYLDRSESASPFGNKFSDTFSSNEIDNKDVELKNYGTAPEFTGISNWLNSEPLTMEELRGKIVLIDFWTYSCINCIRTLPYVTSWYEKYKDQGFVVIGVHTPEFAFEKETNNVQTAMNRHNINYPVAQDNDFGTWQAYSNHYWPAHYLVDQDGQVVFTHFGEGKYEETENTIRYLLGLDTNIEIVDSTKNESRTPEIYFGLDRLDNLHPSQKPVAAGSNLSFPSDLPDNTFALEGKWSFSYESAKLNSDQGKIRLSFNAKNVFMVAESPKPAMVKVLIDGSEVQELEINESKLYNLYESQQGEKHELELWIDKTGFEAFTFTFG
ncbi:MAG: redoxin domain-containing protein [bacterium]|nr:redoxin domain-containing protein [bacterium]